jgi:hypothetical protein
MQFPLRTVICWLAAALLVGWSPSIGAAKGYSSGGGHSYSSHSSSSGGSHSFSSGSHSSGGGASHSSSFGASSGSHASSSSPSKSFNSSSGKSYSSGSSSSGASSHSYTSGKSYSSGAGHAYSSSSHDTSPIPLPSSSPRTKPDSSPAGFTFDNAAARARKEETSKSKFTQFKQSEGGAAAASATTPRPVPDASSYRVQPPPLPGSYSGADRARVYVPDGSVFSTRSVRIYNVYNPYSSRPWVSYHDPYNSLFWWWLLDRSLDDRAWWAYHHRYDMDPARYQALVATDAQLESRVEQLEAQQAPRDPNYVPAGLDRDLMYSDQFVARSYSNRPTTGGVIAFWVLAVPTALAVCGFFVWLIWFKRWQTAN